MNSASKQSLGQLFAIAIIVLTSVFCVKAYFGINSDLRIFKLFPILLPCVVLIIQQVFILPKYFKFYTYLVSKGTSKAGVAEKFIPLYQELSLFSDWKRTAYLAGWMGACVLLVIAQTGLIGLILPVSATLNFSFYLIMIAFICYIAVCVVRGIEFLSIRMELLEIQNSMFGATRLDPLFWVMSFFYFVPLVRNIPILQDIGMYEKFIVFNDVINDKDELEEE